MVWTTPVEELVGEFVTLRKCSYCTGYFSRMGSSCWLHHGTATFVASFWSVCHSRSFKILVNKRGCQEATPIFLKLAAIFAWVRERSDSLPVLLGWWNTAVVFLRLLSSQLLCFLATLVLNVPITATSSGRSWWVQWCGKAHVTVPFFVPSSAAPSVQWLLLLSRRTSMACPWLQGVFLLMCSNTFKNRRPIIQPLVGQLAIQRLRSGTLVITASCILARGTTPTSCRMFPMALMAGQSVASWLLVQVPHVHFAWLLSGPQYTVLEQQLLH